MPAMARNAGAGAAAAYAVESEDVEEKREHLSEEAFAE